MAEWQTRWFQVPVKRFVWVQIPSPAPNPKSLENTTFLRLFAFAFQHLFRWQTHHYMILDISQENFRNIFGDGTFDLPIRWDGKNFEDSLSELFEEYIFRICNEQNADCSMKSYFQYTKNELNISTCHVNNNCPGHVIKQVCNDLVKAVGLYRLSSRKCVVCKIQSHYSLFKAVSFFAITPIQNRRKKAGFRRRKRATIAWKSI